MAREHRYSVRVEWTGNTGTGTSGYRSYERSYEIMAGAAKPSIPGSSDPVFRGDRSRWNPEELLVAALSSCHQLAYLHLCADAGIVVVGYLDRAEGVMAETPDGAGEFTRVILRPRVMVAPESSMEIARELHHQAHAMCFIARSVNFPVECEPEIVAVPA